MLRMTGLIILLVFCTGFLRAAEAQDLIENGSFQNESEGAAQGWQLTKGFSLVKDGEKSWLKLEGTGQLSRWFKIDPSWKAVKLSCRIRGTDVVNGAKGWQTGCLAFDFRNHRGKHTGDWVSIPKVKGSTDWVDFSSEYTIPEGAEKIKIDLANYGKSGNVEFDDISLIPVTE